jgi:hypothetical protein
VCEKSPENHRKPTYIRRKYCKVVPLTKKLKISVPKNVDYGTVGGRGVVITVFNVDDIKIMITFYSLFDLDLRLITGGY